MNPSQCATMLKMICGGATDSHVEVRCVPSRVNPPAARPGSCTLARAPALAPPPLHALSAMAHCSACPGRVHATFAPRCCAIWNDEIAVLRHQTRLHAAQSVLFACCSRSEMAFPRPQMRRAHVP